MGRVIFRNPNNPQQPADGVYRWSYLARGRKIPFYIGRAGAQHRDLVSQPSTLARGISQLQRATGFSANGNRKLGTRFIVGTAIKYLTEKGYDCVWEHILDDPHKEKDLCRKCRSILQDGHTTIRPVFRLTRPDGAAWDRTKRQHLRQAEKRLYKLFDGVFPK